MSRTAANRVLYIASAARSGSTLLDQLLAQNVAIVSLGEAHQLRAYVLEDRKDYDPVHPLVCSCGRPVAACDFWNRVRAALGQPLERLQLRVGVSGTRGRRASPLARAIYRWPQLYRFLAVQRLLGAAVAAHDSFALYDAVAAVTGCRYVLDSSKDPYRFRALYAREPRRVYVVILTRDFRAVAYSQSRRGRTIEDGARNWVRMMRRIRALTADVPVQHLLHVKYEDLCLDTRGTLRAIYDFLELGDQVDMPERTLDDLHHLGGSPSKYDPERRAISLDTRYLTELSGIERSSIEAIASAQARAWGYE